MEAATEAATEETTEGTTVEATTAEEVTETTEDELVFPHKLTACRNHMPMIFK